MKLLTGLRGQVKFCFHSSFSCSLLVVPHSPVSSFIDILIPPPPGGGNLHMKGVGMLVGILN